jgi:hemerythrin-like domain-containing protein
LLLAHGKTEEDLVFAPLDHCLEQIGQRDVFHEEHHEIDASLLKVKAAKRLDEARRLLSVAVLASRKHFDHEERIVFPLAEKAMKRETLTDLGKTWMKQRQAKLV